MGWGGVGWGRGLKLVELVIFFTKNPNLFFLGGGGGGQEARVSEFFLLKSKI